MRKPTMWFPNRSETNRAVQAHMARAAGSFGLRKLEELFNPFRENKAADQLRIYCEDDLRLWFRICRLFVFFTRRLIYGFNSAHKLIYIT